MSDSTIIRNALNEVINGVKELADDGEFHSRIGATRAEALEVLRSIPRAESMTYYIWQVFDTDDEWGLITAQLPQLGDTWMPLMSRRPDVAELMREFAEAHGRAANREVRLAVFQFVRTGG